MHLLRLRRRLRNPLAGKTLSIRGKFMREYFRKIADGEITEKNTVEDYEICLEDLRRRLSSIDGNAVSRENAAWLGYMFMSEMKEETI